MSKSEMFEISSDPKMLHKYLDFDVYYKNNGYYGLYKKKGVAFDSLRIKTGKLPTQLYIALHDRVRLIKSQTRNLNRKLASELRRNPVKAKQRITEVVALSLSEPRSEVLEDIKETIDIVVSEYLNSPDVIRNLLQVWVKDYSTQLHLTNVMLFCLGYAHHTGYGKGDLELFGLIGLLHDVGKVDIPDEILTAPRKLSESEFELIKTHPKKGWKMLVECAFDSKIPTCALQHHERMDGSGYPEGKTEEDLDVYSRALAIIDVYEALTTWRPYKEPIAPLPALEIIKSDVEAGKLDPLIFKEFARGIVRLTGKKSLSSRPAGMGGQPTGM